MQWLPPNCDLADSALHDCWDRTSKPPPVRPQRMTLHHLLYGQRAERRPVRLRSSCPCVCGTLVCTIRRSDMWRRRLRQNRVAPCIAALFSQNISFVHGRKRED
ncbi:hypothetical protein RHECNPAF_12210060 [Rhizobium etli CNPAF512]|nr:hypothetical protein RHECNPAF_12210060 [Rhizobium etli CNPAF512]